jgi:acetyltransferase-like isoleucine patch superfamily enzyme
VPALRRLRFALWAAEFRLRLRRRGVRLVLEAPHGARWGERPRLDVRPGRGGVLELRLGRGVDLGRRLLLEVDGASGGRVELGDGTYFGDGVRVLLEGGLLRTGAHVGLRHGCVLKVGGTIELGPETLVSYFSAIHCAERVELRGRVTLADHTTVVDSKHEADGTDTWHMDAPLSTAPVVIEENVLVGAGTRVLDGAHIGARSVVAANSVVVAGPLPAGYVVAGTPATAVRALGPPA